MHDGKGTPLTIGDLVMVPCYIKSTSANDDFCNLSVETVATMHGGTSKTLITLNTKQVIRANDGDDLTFEHTTDANGVTTIHAVGASANPDPAPKANE